MAIKTFFQHHKIILCQLFSGFRNDYHILQTKPCYSSTCAEKKMYTQNTFVIINS